MTSTIAIFDSGIGGLAVASNLAKLLPNNNIIFAADLLNSPWGDKSNAEVIAYCESITKFLIQQGCSAIVIACNTASAIATQVIKKLADKITVIDIVNPTINYISKNYHNINLGVMGTSITINSKVYNKINILNPSIKIKSLAAPLLVPLIEAGSLDATIEPLQEYLSHTNFANIEALLLACTHYSFLTPYIQKILPNVKIINSTAIISSYLSDMIKPLNSNNKACHKFYISKASDTFNQHLKVLFPDNMYNVEIVKFSE